MIPGVFLLPRRTSGTDVVNATCIQEVRHHFRGGANQTKEIEVESSARVSTGSSSVLLRLPKAALESVGREM